LGSQACPSKEYKIPNLRLSGKGEREVRKELTLYRRDEGILFSVEDFRTGPERKIGNHPSMGVIGKLGLYFPESAKKEKKKRTSKIGHKVYTGKEKG